MPESNQTYWSEKLSRNVDRDKKNVRLLKELGWKVLIIWECELGDLQHLNERLSAFLTSNALRASAG